MATARIAGRYEIVRELARGATARVLLARDVADGGALRALKAVTSALGARARWELDALARISHPNVARVRELVVVGEALPGPIRLDAGTAVLVEDHAEGEDAARRADALSDASAKVAFAVEVGRALSRALAAVHAAGLVHGDVKPANVVVGDDPARAVLVDLGLARPPGVGQIAGTPLYLAPEAWHGERSVATDLYGLGATLHRLLGGRSALDAARGSSSDAGSTRVESASGSLSDLHALATAAPRSAASLPPDLPPALLRLVGALLAADPAERPASARDVASRLDAIAEELSLSAPAAPLFEPTKEERAERLSVLPLAGRSAALTALAEALGAPGVVLVRGPSGAGKTRVVIEAVRALQAARAGAGHTPPTFVRAQGRVPDALPRHDAVVLVEAADAVEVEAAELAVAGALVDGASLSVVLERTSAAGAQAGDRAIDIGSVARDDLVSLLAAAFGHAPSRELAAAAAEASGSLPGRLCRMLARAVAEGVDAARPESLRALSAGDAGASLEVPARAKALAELAAVCGGAVSPEAALRALPDEDLAEASLSLTRAGAATFGADGALHLRPDLIAPLRAKIAPSARRGLGRAVLPALADDASRAFAADASGDAALAKESIARAVRAARTAGDPERALELASLARAAKVGVPSELALEEADALRARGRYSAALALLERAGGADADARRAEVARLIGDRDAAARAAEATRSSGDPCAEALGLATLARLALDRGALDEADGLARSAEATARRAPEATRASTAARALEVGALVAAAQNDVERAAELATASLEAARRAGERALEARALSVSASLALARGEVRLAADRFARAFELADAAGELHAASAFLLNVGIARLDAGELGPAIAALREGSRRLARLGRDQDLARALYHLGLAAVLSGDDDLALHALRHAAVAADRAGDRAVLAYVRVLEAEQALRTGAFARARTLLADARAASPGPGTDADAVVEARVAMALAAMGELDEARSALERSRASASTGAGARPVASAEVALAGTRVSIAEGAGPRAAEESALARTLAERSGAFEARLRAALVSAEAAELALDRDAARSHLAAARALLDGAAATLPPEARVRFRSVASYQRALAAAPLDRGSEHSASDRWRRLVARTKRLTAERRVGRLHEEILDAAIELVSAERGFLVVRDELGALRVKAARSLDRKDVAGKEHALSRSIAARAIDGGRPISTLDALTDERLDTAASVHALALRSVVAVPLHRRGNVAGALYLDDRLRPGAFGPDDVALLVDLAELASIALDGAELLRSERKHARRLEALRRELAKEVETQAEELASLRRATDEGAGLGIVAASEPMKRVLELASRVAPADLPVLVTGESGTGKELVARAIHRLSRRAAAPFVSENCGAIPEPLLESALFGHVRGAFTGAERARVGLFEAADGGTLFLDEIGEMSPAMQAKLLRVVQDGEVRPVGGETARKVDVRIVAATHRDLGRLVAEEKFREDLYYRLAVVTIPVPPLRERPDDIPLLVAHFVEKHGKGRRAKIDPRTLALLASQRWPGNVRQLENEVQRALVLGGGTLDAAHLSTELAASVIDGGAAPAELDLKAQVDALEKRLIRRALDRAGGNQTKAAKLLGVSRFGLQKMLKRLEV